MLGLATTLFVMIQFGAAQPALLYLVPACLGSTYSLAWYRGEVAELLDFEEGIEVLGDVQEEEKKKKTTVKSQSKSKSPARSASKKVQ
jgi:minor histocompatibility antigen H13